MITTALMAMNTSTAIIDNDNDNTNFDFNEVCNDIDDNDDNN